MTYIIILPIQIKYKNYIAYKNLSRKKHKCCLVILNSKLIAYSFQVHIEEKKWFGKNKSRVYSLFILVYIFFDLLHLFQFYSNYLT
jgi:hypothetical protein